MAQQLQLLVVLAEDLGPVQHTESHMVAPYCLSLQFQGIRLCSLVSMGTVSM